MKIRLSEDNSKQWTTLCTYIINSMKQLRVNIQKNNSDLIKTQLAYSTEMFNKLKKILNHLNEK